MVVILLNIIATIALIGLLMIDDNTSSSILWKVLLILILICTGLNIAVRIS